MRTFLVSYATPRFEDVRRELVDSAIKWNVRGIISYDLAWLQQTEFYTENQELLDEICGAGFWAWKPYVILEALKQLEEDDVLFYCDAGTAFIDAPQPLIDICRNSDTGIVLFDARPLVNRQFTKRDCFVRLGCDAPQHWDARKVIATIIVMRRTDFVMQLLREWKHFCQDRRAVSTDNSLCGLPELSGFLQHRWDQAILSVLASKYSIETFRNPTVWGNFLKLPPFRVDGERVESPYGLVPEITTYAESPQGNSPYGTVFEINRLPNMVGKPPMVLPVGNGARASLTSRLIRRMRALKQRRFVELSSR